MDTVDDFIHGDICIDTDGWYWLFLTQWNGTYLFLSGSNPEKLNQNDIPSNTDVRNLRESQVKNIGIRLLVPKPEGIGKAYSITRCTKCNGILELEGTAFVTVCGKCRNSKTRIEKLET